MDFETRLKNAEQAVKSGTKPATVQQDTPKPAHVQFEDRLKAAEAAAKNTPSVKPIQTEPVTIKTGEFTAAQKKQLAHLEELRRQAVVDDDNDTVLQLDQRMKEIRRQAGKQTIGDRVSDSVTSAVSGSFAGVSNAAGMAVEALEKQFSYEDDIKRLNSVLDAGVTSDGQVLTDEKRAIIQQSIDEMKAAEAKRNSPNSVKNKLYQFADVSAKNSEDFRETAKEDLGVVGQTVVDAGISFGQSMLDAGIGALTGTGMAPFVVRAFGGSGQEARLNGADFKSQVIYATSEAGKEYLTEKLFGLALPQKVLGKAGAGGLDGVIESGIKKFVAKSAKTEGGQRVLGGLMTWLMSGATEGAEEVIGDVIENVVINPLLRDFDPDTRTFQEKVDDALNDFLVGTVSGLFGVTNLFTYEADTSASQPAATDPTQANPAPAQTPETAPAKPVFQPKPKSETAKKLEQAGASAEEITKLEKPVAAVLNGEDITDKQAATIAKSEAAVSVIEAETGVKIDTDAPMSDVKETIRGINKTDKVEEPTPAEQKPAEQKPEEQKPVEQKPAEQKPAEQKPAEQKPAEQKPVEKKTDESAIEKVTGKKAEDITISDVADIFNNGSFINWDKVDEAIKDGSLESILKDMDDRDKKEGPPLKSR